MPPVGMEDEDRQNITRNIGRLVELTNIDLLIPKLLEKGVFSSMMIEDYLPSARFNSQQRKTALYLDIQRRGPTAFGKLIASLIETEHYELAKLLQPDLDIQLIGRQESVASDALPSGSQITRSPFNNIPPYFSHGVQNRIEDLTHIHPNAVLNLSTEPLRVAVKYATFRSDLQPPKPNIAVYPMGSRPKGYVLMINNIKFVNDVCEMRKGAEADDLNLTILFQELGYEVMSYQNLTLNEMKRKIQDFSQMENHKRVHSCIIAILSHGFLGEDGTDFAASDGSRLSSTWVLERFNNYFCPALMGRPKIFIFQTCRGNKEDFGVTHVQRPMNFLPTQRIVTDGFPASQVRSYSDMLIAYSTIPDFCISPGFVSNRDIYCGTWYIQTICNIFMEHAHDTEIQDMLIMVDNRMKHLIAENSSMQTTSYENWGFQKFYFNPGLYDDSNSNESLMDEVPENEV